MSREAFGERVRLARFMAGHGWRRFIIKLTANPRTLRTMGEHIDLDVTGILRRDMTLEEAGDALIDMVVRTASGRATAAEALGHREFVMTKLYRSA